MPDLYQYSTAGVPTKTVNPTYLLPDVAELAAVVEVYAVNGREDPLPYRLSIGKGADTFMLSFKFIDIY